MKKTSGSPHPPERFSAFLTNRGSLRRVTNLQLASFKSLPRYAYGSQWWKLSTFLLFWMFGRGSTYGPNVQRQPPDLEIHQSGALVFFRKTRWDQVRLLFQQTFRTISCPKHKVFEWNCKTKIWISLKIHPLLGCFELGGAPPLFGKGRNLGGIWMFVKYSPDSTTKVQQPKSPWSMIHQVMRKYKMVLYLNKKPVHQFSWENTWHIYATKRVVVCFL